MTTSETPSEHYCADGVSITHDPKDPHLIQKYGRQGETDQEGFNPGQGSALGVAFSPDGKSTFPPSKI